MLLYIRCQIQLMIPFSMKAPQTHLLQLPLSLCSSYRTLSLSLILLRRSDQPEDSGPVVAGVACCTLSEARWIIGVDSGNPIDRLLSKNPLPKL